MNELSKTAYELCNIAECCHFPVNLCSFLLRVNFPIDTATVNTLRLRGDRWTTELGSSYPTESIS